MITVVDILSTAICYLVFNKVSAMHSLLMNSILIRFCDHGADVNLCQRGFCFDAWPRYTYIYCTPSSCTMPSRADLMASSSTESFEQPHLKLGKSYQQCL